VERGGSGRARSTRRPGWRPADRKPPGIGPPALTAPVHPFGLIFSFRSRIPQNPGPDPASRRRGPPGLPARSIPPGSAGRRREGRIERRRSRLAATSARFSVRRRESRQNRWGRRIQPPACGREMNGHALTEVGGLKRRDVRSTSPTSTIPSCHLSSSDDCLAVISDQMNRKSHRDTEGRLQSWFQQSCVP